MNQNIEVISKDLWAVNFDYITLGYIQEFLSTNVQPTDHVIYMPDGKVVLNKNHKNFKAIKKYYSTLMEFPNQLLGTIHGYYHFVRKLVPNTNKLSDPQILALTKKVKLEDVEKFFYIFSDLEKQRRKLQAEYIKATNNKKIKG